MLLKSKRVSTCSKGILLHIRVFEVSLKSLAIYRVLRNFEIFDYCWRTPRKIAVWKKDFKQVLEIIALSHNKLIRIQYKKSQILVKFRKLNSDCWYYQAQLFMFNPITN